MLRNTWMALAMATMVASSGMLGGCFFIADDDWDDHHGHDDGYRNDAPIIFDGPETFWFCDYDAGYHDYVFEFQALVADDDGLSDIAFVDVSFYDQYSGVLLEQFDLYDEGMGIWGAFALEHETLLFCGEDYDVEFYVEDWSGRSDSLTMFDVNAAPMISDHPDDTWVDCYQYGHDFVFEFQAFVDDMDGFGDVDYVEVSFYNLYTGRTDGVYSLGYELDGFWGGWIEEGNGNTLYCGDLYDVTFYAEDWSGATDQLSFEWGLL